jgi:regulator of sigma E protease
MSELNPIPFVIALGVLVTLHELGHFLAAKWCGVRVLKFSIGFGNPIGFGRFRLRWLRGGTEYVVAWIPLGGFVKMLGENPGEEESPAALADRKHSLPAQPLWKKLTIVLAGPFVNLALPVVYFAALLWIGVPQKEPVIGSVEAGSPAARADLRAGDRLLAVNGREIESWQDVERTIVEQPGARLAWTVERDGARVERSIQAEARPGLDELLLPGEVGWIGIQHERQEARVVVSDATSPAAQAGLRSGDLVTSVAGRAVADWSELDEALAAAPAQPVAIAVQRGEQKLALTLPAGSDLAALGVTPLAFSVESVSDGTPAARAGLEPGDVILAFDGQPVGSFQTFYATVRASEGRALQLEYARGGEIHSVAIAPARVKGEAHEGEKEVWRIGIAPRPAQTPGVVAERRVRNPLESIPLAVGMTVNVTQQILESLRRVVVGRISLDNIGGPIAIASQSKQAWELGLGAFVSMIVFLSINLGVLNLLPIPVLDGGQAVMFTLEAALRERFSVRARELAQTVGLALLLMLMGVAFYNDITNYVVGFVRSLLRA